MSEILCSLVLVITISCHFHSCMHNKYTYKCREFIIDNCFTMVTNNMLHTGYSDFFVRLFTLLIEYNCA